MVKRCLLALALACAAPAPPLAAQTPEPRTFQVEIKGFAFAPAALEIHAGDIVEWTNRDFAPHSATADAGAWDSGAIRNQASARFVAGAPGSFAYHCKFHPHMKGAITVLAP